MPSYQMSVSHKGYRKINNCVHEFGHIVLKIYDFERSVLVFCKWQPICESEQRVLFFWTVNTCSWNVIEWRCWWNDSQNGQLNRFCYATLRYVTFVDVIWRLYSVHCIRSSSCCTTCHLWKHTEKVFTLIKFFFREMGSLKAIADNQHVKYAIFAKYTKYVR